MEYTRARKFWTDLRMELRPKDRYYKGSGKNKIKYGHEVEAVIIKNKIGTNGKRARFNIYYDSGIDYEDDLINVASNLDVINKAGSWYTYNYDVDIKPDSLELKDNKDMSEEDEKLTEEVESIEIKKQGKSKMLKKLREMDKKGYNVFEQIKDKVKSVIDNRA